MPEGLDRCGVVLSNVFSRAECQRIIAATEEIGYGPIGEVGTRLTASYTTNTAVSLELECELRAASAVDGRVPTQQTQHSRCSTADADAP